MKRAGFVFVAALLVLLVYPSTHPLAVSPDKAVADGPTVITPSNDNPPIAYSGENDGDDGDSDDVAGNRKGMNDPLTTSYDPDNPTRVKLMFQMWWKFLIWIR